MVTTERVPDCDSPHGRGGAASWGATKERNDLLDAAAQPEPPHNGCCAQPGAQLTHHNSAPAGIHRPTQQPEGRLAKSNTSNLQHHNLQPIPMESDKYVRKVMEGGSNTAIDYVEQRQGEGHLDADNQSPLDLQVEARPLSDTWKPRPPCSTLPNSRSSRRRGYDADGRPQTRTDPQSQWARIPFSIPVGHTGFSSKQFASDLDPGASSLSPPPIQVRYPPPSVAKHQALA